MGGLAICTRAHRPEKIAMQDTNMTIVAFPTPVSKPLGPRLQKACYTLLVGGALVFALGLSFGFAEHANPVLVYLLLGVTTLMFGLVVAMLLKPGVFAFIGGDAAKPHAGDDGAPAVQAGPEPHPEAPVLQPGSDEKPSVEPPVEAAPGAKSTAEIPAKTDLAILMNTTLGDVMLAALRSDPEGAGRIFARAITQAEVSAPVAGAKQSEASAPS
jgi:hypothetical protein